MDDDRELLERIRRGDGESFGVLYDRTRGWLLSCVILPRVGRAAAEDVLSETFRTALARIGSFEWRDTGLLHWLASIARKKALERVRAEARGAREEPFSRLFDPPDAAPTAEAEMIRAEALAETYRAARYEAFLKARTEELLGTTSPAAAPSLSSSPTPGGTS